MIDAINMNSKRNRLLLKCLAVSLVLHAAGLLYFYKKPILMSSALGSMFNKSAPQPLLLEESEDLLTKNVSLEEAFENIEIASSYKDDAMNKFETKVAAEPIEDFYLDEEFAPNTLAILQDEELFFSIPTLEFPATSEEDIYLAEENAPAPLVHATEIPKESFVVDIDDVTLPEIVYSYENEESSFLIPIDPSYQEQGKINFNLDLFAGLSDMKVELKPSGRSVAIETREAAQKAPLAMPKPLNKPPETWRQRTLAKTVSLPEAAAYPLPDGPSGLLWSDDFDVHVQLIPDESKKGYVFSIVLQPLSDLSSEKIKQNVSFLIDRATSLEKYRFNVYKKAVLKAISYLQTGDTFNIVFFDNKITRFNPENLPYSKKTQQMAEEFLENAEQGGFFSSADIFSSLEKIMPVSRDEKEVHTAILISDGNTGLNSRKLQKAISKWTEKNKGNISVYSAAVGTGNNLMFLNLLSSLNRGSLLYADTNASFPRKLAKLVYTLNNPIAKDVAISVKNSDPDVKISLYADSVETPNLYNKQPYTIFGEIDQLSDFTLSLQGKNDEEWVTIDKKISFENVKQGNRLMQKKWAIVKSRSKAKKYLDDGKVAYLDEAKEILKPYGFDAAFE